MRCPAGTVRKGGAIEREDLDESAQAWEFTDRVEFAHLVFDDVGRSAY
jgi:hypothetical protein